GDHPGLAHAFGEQGLAEHVVDLVGAGVVEVLTFEEDAGPTRMFCEVTGLGQWARSAGVLLEQPIEFGLEGRVLAGLVPLGGDFVESGEECFGRKTATESAVVPEGVGHRLVVAHGKSPGRRGRRRHAPACLAGDRAPADRTSYVRTAARGQLGSARPGPPASGGDGLPGGITRCGPCRTGP